MTNHPFFAVIDRQINFGLIQPHEIELYADFKLQLSIKNPESDYSKFLKCFNLSSQRSFNGENFTGFLEAFELFNKLKPINSEVEIAAKNMIADDWIIERPTIINPLFFLKNINKYLYEQHKNKASESRKPSDHNSQSDSQRSKEYESEHENYNKAPF